MEHDRRLFLKRVAAGLGVAAGGSAAVGSVAAEDGDSESGANRSAVIESDATGARAVGQQVDTSLAPGVTLFDLNDDGSYTATVEAAAEEMRDGSHPRPIHVTSNGNSTVDYAASIAEPGTQTTLSGLERLTYDYYEGPDNVGQTGGAPDETFLVVENDDGRHGMYLTSDSGPSEQWTTFDVLDRMRGGGQWFEYTEIEEGYDGQNFGNVVERYGEDATLVRVGVGRGDAVSPVTLDVFYDNLVVNDATSRFPVSVAKRVSHENPF